MSSWLLQLREEARSLPKVIQLLSKTAKDAVPVKCRSLVKNEASSICLLLLLKDSQVAISKSCKPQTKTSLHHPTPCCYDKHWRCILLLRIPENFFFLKQTQLSEAKWQLSQSLLQIDWTHRNKLQMILTSSINMALCYITKIMFKGCLLEADIKSESAASKQCAVVQILEINIKIWNFVLK